MPICEKLLATSDFTPEQRHVFELAFNSALRKFNLVDRNDPICEMIARKVIEIGLTRGEPDAAALAEQVLKHFQV